jgi:hypothetical protein
LPRLSRRLKGKKGVNRHASPYRLKNYDRYFNIEDKNVISTIDKFGKIMLAKFSFFLELKVPDFHSLNTETFRITNV